MTELILLDMDGVIANFVDSSLKVCNIPLTHDQVNRWDYYHGHMTEQEFWRAIDCTPDFWKDIKPYEWAEELLEMCRDIAPVYFCSSPAMHHVSASDKIWWLRTHGFMKADEENYILTKHKHMLANRRRILIDDGTHQIDAFNAQGGIGLEFPQPWNDGVLTAVRDIRMSFMRRSLDRVDRCIRLREES